jgi:hypothetical protein
MIRKTNVQVIYSAQSHRTHDNKRTETMLSVFHSFNKESMKLSHEDFKLENDGETIEGSKFKCV